LLINIGSFDLEKIKEMEPQFLEEEGQDHVHDLSISSVGFKIKEPLDFNKMHEFIREMLTDMGPDLFRYKGVISIKGKD